METLSLKLPKSLGTKLASTAKRRGTTKSTIVREALEGYLAADGEALPASFAAQAKEFIGCVDGGAGRLGKQQEAFERVWQVKPVVLLDTGPLVAFLHRRDKHHNWAFQQFSKLEPPFHTCEPVLTESCFLLRGLKGGSEAVLKLVDNGLIRVAMTLTDEVTTIRRLMAKYADVPISLADACLVRLSENHSNGVVLTLDGDFRIYRKHGRQVIPTIMPKAK